MTKLKDRLRERVYCTKRIAIRPGFETVSSQHAALAQQRSYLFHAELFLEYAKIEQGKERRCWQSDTRKCGGNIKQKMSQGNVIVFLLFFLQCTHLKNY